MLGGLCRIYKVGVCVSNLRCDCVHLIASVFVIRFIAIFVEVLKA